MSVFVKLSNQPETPEEFSLESLVVKYQDLVSSTDTQQLITNMPVWAFQQYGVELTPVVHYVPQTSSVTEDPLWEDLKSKLNKLPNNQRYAHFSQYHALINVGVSGAKKAGLTDRYINLVKKHYHGVKPELQGYNIDYIYCYDIKHHSRRKILKRFISDSPPFNFEPDQTKLDNCWLEYSQGSEYHTHKLAHYTGYYINKITKTKSPEEVDLIIDNIIEDLVSINNNPNLLVIIMRVWATRYGIIGYRKGNNNAMLDLISEYIGEDLDHRCRKFLRPPVDH